MSSPAAGDPAPRRTLGLLCVHGIGEQGQGDTLDEFGGPILRWLRRWLEPRGGEVIIRRCVLNAAQLEPGEPMHAVVELAVPQNGGDPVRHEWIVAESWWAADFRAPSFRQLSPWLLSQGCWILLSHVANLWQGRIRAWSGGADASVARRVASRTAVVVGTLLVAMVATLAVFVVQLAVVLLTVLSIVPIPVLRAWTKGVLLRLQGVLGDSFVFATNPLARAAVESHVRADLEWLQSRCERIAVLAHSQGAAVTVSALEGRRFAKLHALLTYGSGLFKLSELRTSAGEHPTLTGLIRMLLLLVPLYVVFTPYLWEVYSARLVELWDALVQMVTELSLRGARRSLADFALFLLLIPLLVPIALIVFAMTRSGENRKRVRARIAAISTEVPRWVDLSASHDPVSTGVPCDDDEDAGVIADPEPADPDATAPARYVPRRVTNRMSALTDHTTYWHNEDEFVTAVVAELDARTGSRIVRESDHRRLDRIANEREPRVRTLRRFRLVLIACVIAPLILSFDRVVSFGQMRVAAPLVQFLFDVEGVDAVRRLDTEIDVGAGRIQSTVNSLWDGARISLFWLLGAGLPLLLAWLWYRHLTSRSWRLWDRIATARVFANHAAADDGDDRRGAIVAVPITLLWLAGLAPVYIAIRSVSERGVTQVFADIGAVSSAFAGVYDSLADWEYRHRGWWWIAIGAVFVVALIVGVVRSLARSSGSS